MGQNKSNLRESEKDYERGAKDDWEALKILLESMPPLKQRVLHKIREMRQKESATVSRKDQAEARREQGRNTKS